MAERPDDLFAELRELGSIDLESVAASEVPRLPRAVLDDVDAVEREVNTVVVVTLSYGDRRAVGTSRGGHDASSIDRTAARATLAALEELIPPGLVEWHVDRVETLGSQTPNRPMVTHVSIAVRTARGEELLVGSAIVKDTTYEAAVKATLDALNRQFGQFVQ